MQDGKRLRRSARLGAQLFAEASDSMLATDTVHTSSFECRATLFQRLFASPSDFDLVCHEFLADGNQSKL